LRPGSSAVTTKFPLDCWMSTAGLHAVVSTLGEMPRNARSISSVNSRITANGLNPKNLPTGNIGVKSSLNNVGAGASGLASDFSFVTFTSGITTPLFICLSRFQHHKLRATSAIDKQHHRLVPATTNGF